MFLLPSTKVQSLLESEFLILNDADTPQHFDTADTAVIPQPDVPEENIPCSPLPPHDVIGFLMVQLHGDITMKISCHQKELREIELAVLRKNFFMDEKQMMRSVTEFGCFIRHQMATFAFSVSCFQGPGRSFPHVDSTIGATTVK